MCDISAQELGHAAAYEAFRIWIHNSQLYEPLSADPLRQREALVGLAVAEAMRLYQQSPMAMAMDSLGLYPAVEAAAATAAMLFQDIFASESMGAMGATPAMNPAMGGTALGAAPGIPYAGAGMPTGAPTSAVGGVAGGALGGYDAGSPADAYLSDYSAPWFSRGRSLAGLGTSGVGTTGIGPPSPIQLSRPYPPRSVSPYNVAGATPGAASTIDGTSDRRLLSPFRLGSGLGGGLGRTSTLPLSSTSAHQPLASSTTLPTTTAPVQQVQTQPAATTSQTPLVLDRHGRPYAGATTYQQPGGATVIELPSRRRRHRHHHHSSSS